jgi:hypothetical protein
VGLSSLASLKDATTLTHAASETFSRALRDIRAALEDPAEAASDQMLVAVMLLELYEVSIDHLSCHQDILYMLTISTRPSLLALMAIQTHGIDMWMERWH